jgi:aldose sugar dehydrogenase
MKKFTLLFMLIMVYINSFGQLTQTAVAINLNTPWEILWGMDDHIWVTERAGIVSRIDPLSGEKKILLDITDSVYIGGERGLMGMAINYAASGGPEVYIAYNYNSGGAKVKVVRYSYDSVNDTLLAPIKIIDNITGNNNHNGCRLVVDANYLYITTGDAEDEARPQNSNSVNGKILRLNLDGSIPVDNPLPGNPMWSKGHRNPQGLVMANGRLYSSEHGPSNDDEVNIIENGRNYGWPNVQGFCDNAGEIIFCNDSNVAEPIIAWTPTLAVAGIDYYDKTLIPDLTNSLLLVSLKAGRLIQLKLNTSGDSVISETTIINSTYGRLRDLCISPDGRIFIATSNRDGRGTPIATDDRIIELKPQANGINTLRDDHINVYPNPVRPGENIYINFGEKTSGYYSIIDIAGKKIDQQEFNEIISGNIDTEGMNSGFYFLNLITDKYTITKKIVIN